MGLQDFNKTRCNSYNVVINIAGNMLRKEMIYEVVQFDGMEDNKRLSRRQRNESNN
jgi:hypothetical protein